MSNAILLIRGNKDILEVETDFESVKKIVWDKENVFLVSIKMWSSPHTQQSSIMMGIPTGVYFR